MPESERHKKLKKQIASFFSARGWQSQEEAQGSGWRADCLVKKAGRQAAIEIELSQPSIVKIKQRAASYKRDGIPSLWLVPKRERTFKRDYRRDHDSGELPIFAIEEKDGQEYIYLEERRCLPLNTFLSALDDGRLHFRETTLDPGRLGALVSFSSNCYHCQKQMTVCRGIVFGLCLCGQLHLWPTQMPEQLFKQELRKVWDPLSSPFGPPAFYRQRRGRYGTRYAAHCPGCNKMQGNSCLQREASLEFQRFLSGDDPSSCQVRYLGSDIIGPDHLHALSREDCFVHWCLEK